VMGALVILSAFFWQPKSNIKNKEFKMILIGTLGHSTH
jgi:hypothetical protein